MIEEAKDSCVDSVKRRSIGVEKATNRQRLRKRSSIIAHCFHHFRGGTVKAGWIVEMVHRLNSTLEILLEVDIEIEK